MKLPVPKEILTQHTAVLGKTRSGKSSVMRLLVESLLERSLPVCIVDPKGDWWGIKLAADGKRAGYPVVIFGGEHADIPINEHAGAHVAELFATGNRPCLIDLGGWMPGPRTKFWIDFASTLFKHTKGERWLAVDEIHNFAPKGKVLDVDAGKALHWTNRLASEGLGKGVALLFASQRPQKVHNDTLTSAETLIAMRVLHPSDRGAVSDWIKGCGDSEGGEVLNSLAQMERGEGWVWSPEIGFGPRRVKFPLFQTYDSFRPQTPADTKKLTGWAEVNLDEVRAKLATVVEAAKLDDPKELRKQIGELRKELTQLQRAQPPTGKVELKTVEKFVLKDGQLARLEKLYERIFNEAERHREAMLQFWPQQSEEAKAMLGVLQLVIEGPADVAAMRPKPTLVQRPVATKAPTPARPARGSDDSNLPPGERAILTAIAQYRDGATREQLTILTGYKKSSRDAYIQRLTGKGYIVVNGRGDLVATSDGVAALGDFEPLPTGDALREWWLARLPPGEAAVLRVAIDTYPEDVGRDVITESTGYKKSSRDAYIQRLAARKLLTVGRASVTASEVLFG